MLGNMPFFKFKLFYSCSRLQNQMLILFTYSHPLQSFLIGAYLRHAYLPSQVLELDISWCNTAYIGGSVLNSSTVVTISLYWPSYLFETPFSLVQSVKVTLKPWKITVVATKQSFAFCSVVGDLPHNRGQ